MIPNRRDAIRYCIENAQEHDIVVLAGKGHEDYQEIKGVKRHFDEREIVADIFERAGYGGIRMEPIRICEIVTAVGGALWKGNPNAEVTSVSTNSRELEPGALFVPIVGEKVDAHRFIPMALDTGAVACFTQQEPEEGFKYLDGAVIRVGDTQKALQDFAAWYRKRFTLPVVGVTGSGGNPPLRR